MAPRGVSQGSRLRQAALARKRQPRRVGRARKGRIEFCKALPALPPKDALTLSSVNGAKEAEQMDESWRNADLSSATDQGAESERHGGNVEEYTDTDCRTYIEFDAECSVLQLQDASVADGLERRLDNASSPCEVDALSLESGESFSPSERVFEYVAEEQSVEEISDEKSAAPLAEEVPLPVFPELQLAVQYASSQCSAKSTKRVQFDFEATEVDFVIPYAEIYGEHPRTFVFDRHGEKIAASPGGFNSAGYVNNKADLLQDDDCEEPNPDDRSSISLCDAVTSGNAEDDDWESWLSSTDYAEECFNYEEFEKNSARFMHEGLPDLDDETGWDSWLESTLGRLQD